MKVIKEEDKNNYRNYQVKGYKKRIIDSKDIITILNTDLGEVIYYIDSELPDPQLTRARIQLKPSKTLTKKERNSLLKMCELYITARAIYEINYEGAKA